MRMHCVLCNQTYNIVGSHKLLKLESKFYWFPVRQIMSYLIAYKSIQLILSNNKIQSLKSIMYTRLCGYAQLAKHPFQYKLCLIRYWHFHYKDKAVFRRSYLFLICHRAHGNSFVLCALFACKPECNFIGCVSEFGNFMKAVIFTLHSSLKSHNPGKRGRSHTWCICHVVYKYI